MGGGAGWVCREDVTAARKPRRLRAHSTHPLGHGAGACLAGVPPSTARWLVLPPGRGSQTQVTPGPG